MFADFFIDGPNPAARYITNLDIGHDTWSPLFDTNHLAAFDNLHKLLKLSLNCCFKRPNKDLKSGRLKIGNYLIYYLKDFVALCFGQYLI
jgi:hypothetical protein